jgi:CO/xanthine dehydrogenase Mo-binding subunit
MYVVFALPEAFNVRALRSIGEPLPPAFAAIANALCIATAKRYQISLCKTD